MNVLPISSVMCSPAKMPVHRNLREQTEPTQQETTEALSFKGFTCPILKKTISTSVEKAEYVANSLSTSTSGHRAVYGSENFSKAIVTLLTLGVASYVNDLTKDSKEPPTVLIGGDTRQASRECLPLIAKTLSKQGVNVLYAEEPVPTPLHAMASRDCNVDLAILMTASHNPWADGGYNLVTKDGAIAANSVTQEVAKHVVDIAKKGFYTERCLGKGNVTKVDLFDQYSKQLDDYNLINWDNIKDSGLKIYYDSLDGTGQYVMPKLLEKHGLNYTMVKSYGQEGPNPTSANLKKLKDVVVSDSENLKVGLANDGDADRFGVVDEKGNFVNANDVILLVGYHLAKNRGKEGAIIRSQATSMQLDALADKYNLEKYETPVGFKFIGEDIIDLRKEGKDVLVAGEESGGLTVNGHIPEKDGIIALSLIMDLIAQERKPLSEILTEVKSSLPIKVVSENYSVKLMDDAAKAELMAKAETIYNNAVAGDTKFGDSHEIDVERTVNQRAEMMKYKKGGDGIKLFLTDGSSILVRKSGTEPLVKFYIESASTKSMEEAEANKNVIRAEADKIFKV